jgi:hypothetical protein
VVLAASFPGARSTHAQLDPQEQLPTGTVAVAQRLDVRHLLPLLVEDHGLRPLWIEERFRRSDERLHEAAVEAAHRRAEGAVDLDLKKVVALDAVSPRRADLSQNTARELENRKGGVLDIDIVAFAALVATLGIVVVWRHDTDLTSPNRRSKM